MTKLGKILNKNSDISLEAFETFHTFLMENLFHQLPEGTTIEPGYAYTTLSYFQARYLIQLPEKSSILSIVVIAGKSFGTGERTVHTDYLKSDYAILDKEKVELLSEVRIFEGDFDNFKAIFYQKVLSSYQSH